MADSSSQEVQQNQSQNDTISGRKHDGLIGLVNIGNSCYMNASLQALSNCQPFSRFFIECFPSKLDSPAPVSCAINQLLKKMWISERNPGHLNPRNISSNMQQRIFHGSSQQDAQEFLRCLLNQIHEELSLPVYQNLTIPEKQELGKAEGSSRQQGECTVSIGSLSSTSSTGSLTRLMQIPQNNEIRKSNSLPNSPLNIKRSKSNDLQRNLLKSQHLSTDAPSNHETQKVKENGKERLDEGKQEKEESPLWNNEDTIVVDLKTGNAYKHNHNEESSRNDGVCQKIDKKNNRVKRSIITEVFEGVIESSVKCLNCHNVSTIQETFQDLSLPIPEPLKIEELKARTNCRNDTTNNDRNKDNSPSHTPKLSSQMCRAWNVVYNWARDIISEPPTALDNCFNAFFDPCDLTGDNRYYCEHCNSLQNSRKTAIITKLPEVLCVHLKRFRYDTFFTSKISKFIDFPLNDLNLVKYMKKPTDDTDHYKYELVSMVTHYGGASGGHYIAFAKNYKTKRWYEFNDSRVSQVSADTVAETEAYLLFYRKIPNIKISKLNIEDIIPPQEITIPSEDTSYISRHWLMLRNLCVNPGPLIQYHYACEHGGILPGKEEYADLLILPIQRSIWNDLVKTYGGGTILESTKTCIKCENYFSELNLRREKEKNEANKVQAGDKSSPNCYILSTYWLKQWQNFINCNSKSLVSEVDPPGPIINSCLLQSTKDDKIKFRYKSQYRTVSYKVWRYLFDIYGGGPHLTTQSPETLEL